MATIVMNDIQNSKERHSIENDIICYFVVTNTIEKLKWLDFTVLQESWSHCDPKTIFSYEPMFYLIFSAPDGVIWPNVGWSVWLQDFSVALPYALLVTIAALDCNSYVPTFGILSPTFGILSPTFGLFVSHLVYSWAIVTNIWAICHQHLDYCLLHNSSVFYKLSQEFHARQTVFAPKSFYFNNW